MGPPKPPNKAHRIGEGGLLKTPPQFGGAVRLTARVGVGVSHQVTLNEGLRECYKGGGLLWGGSLLMGPPKPPNKAHRIGDGGLLKTPPPNLGSGLRDSRLGIWGGSPTRLPSMKGLENT